MNLAAETEPSSPDNTKLMLSKNDIAFLRKSLTDVKQLFESVPTNASEPAGHLMDLLIGRMRQLDGKKQEHLLRFLESLENQTSSDELSFDILNTEVQNVDEGFTQLVLRVLSTWGSSSVGLTEV